VRELAVVFERDERIDARADQHVRVGQQRARGAGERGNRALRAAHATAAGGSQQRM
jgi:hypothetical protein